LRKDLSKKSQKQKPKESRLKDKSVERLPIQIICLYRAENYKGMTEEQKAAHERIIDEKFEKDNEIEC